MQVKREFEKGFVVALNSLKRNYKPYVYLQKKDAPKEPPFSLQNFTDRGLITPTCLLDASAVGNKPWLEVAVLYQATLVIQLNFPLHRV
jgi:hypothetical protein